MSFNVEVTSSNFNNTPTINNISSFKLANTVGPQLVNLTGISDGDINKSQELTITAESSDQSVIANGDIVVNYTQGNTSGSISFNISGTLEQAP